MKKGKAVALTRSQMLAARGCLQPLVIPTLLHPNGVLDPVARREEAILAGRLLASALRSHAARQPVVCPLPALRATRLTHRASRQRLITGAQKRIAFSVDTQVSVFDFKPSPVV